MTDKDLNQLFNSFKKKDMPRQEFIKEMKSIMDPKQAQRDLETIQLRKKLGL